MSSLHAEIDHIRAAIAATDRQIIALIARRVELARCIGAAKQAHGVPVCDPAREAAVLREAAAAARDEELDPEIVRQIYWCIIGLCRGEQLSPGSH